MIDGKVLELGGRRFVPTEQQDITFHQWSWIAAAQSRAGLDDQLTELVEPVLRLAHSRGLEEVPLNEAHGVAVQIIARVFESRAHTRLLAGMLVEEGKPWTFEGAEANERFFGQLTGKDDFAVLQEAIIQIVFAFFWHGLVSSQTSLKSSLNQDGAAEAPVETTPDQGSTSASSEP